MFVYYHNINPVAFSLGSIDIYYYGLVYVFALLFLWYMLRRFFDEDHFSGTAIASKDDIDNIVFATAFLSFIFARLFYVLLYDFGFYSRNLFEILAIWHGGMSILGGFVGAGIALLYLARKYNCSFYLISDAIFLYIPFLLVFGRIANFINAEVIGKIAPATALFCIDYSKNLYISDAIIGCRYPSQIFEAVKNLIIFATLYFTYIKYYKEDSEYYETGRNKRLGLITILFFLCYSFLRFVVEFFKEPDYLLLGYSVNQIIFGILFLCIAATLMYQRFRKHIK